MNSCGILKKSAYMLIVISVIVCFIAGCGSNSISESTTSKDEPDTIEDNSANPIESVQIPVVTETIAGLPAETPIGVLPEPTIIASDIHEVETSTEPSENVLQGNPDNASESSQRPPAVENGIMSEETDANVLTSEQRNSINMLNYLTVLVQKINMSSNSRLFLEGAYSELINNTEPSIVDELTLDEYEKLLSVIDGYRMVAVQRERLQFMYEQNSAKSIRSAIPNPLALLSVVQSGNPLKSLVSVAYLALDSANSYQSKKSELELQFLQNGLQLNDDEQRVLSDNRSSMFSYMVRVARNLPAGLTLNEDSVKDFVKWSGEPNVTSRIRWFESNETTYKNYGEYWLVLAQSYYEKAQFGGNEYYKECLNAIAEYERLDNSIFRKDIKFAQVLPYAIVAAQETLDDVSASETCDRLADAILSNTFNSDWSLRYFAAQTFVDLYSRTSNKEYLETAYEIVFDNVNELVSEQRDMNNVYLSDIKTEATKGLKGDEKERVEEYNSMLKAARNIELAPIYEPLRVNCDLLFALANRLHISTAKQADIDSILHPNGETLFLNPVIDKAYRFSASGQEIDADSIFIKFDGAKIVLPAMYLSDAYSVELIIDDKNCPNTISDWIVDKVNRNKSSDEKDFTAILVSDKAGEFDYSAGSIVTIRITSLSDDSSSTTPLIFRFNVIQNTYVWLIHTLSFERVI